MRYENLSKKVQMSVNKKSSDVNKESFIDVKNLKIMSFPKSTTFFIIRRGIAFVLGATLVVGGTFYIQHRYIDEIESKGQDISIVQHDDSYNVAETEKVFQTGEHIISIPLGDKTVEDIKQYDTYEGYKLEGVFNKDKEAVYLKYVNVEPVKCKVSNYDEKGNYLYLDFGSPVEFENLKTR